mmetsp:Transcript_6397/g.15673  ORF Transcript_6397/g.15673 Transcript_6397/m.15673 type:complete len:115 (+) Transcript_6397:187-531(+)
MAGMGSRAWQARLASPSVKDAKAFLNHHMAMQLGMQEASGNARLLSIASSSSTPAGLVSIPATAPGSYGAESLCREERIRRASGLHGGCSLTPSLTTSERVCGNAGYPPCRLRA